MAKHLVHQAIVTLDLHQLWNNYCYCSINAHQTRCHMLLWDLQNHVVICLFTWCLMSSLYVSGRVTEHITDSIYSINAYTQGSFSPSSLKKQLLLLSLHFSFWYCQNKKHIILYKMLFFYLNDYDVKSARVQSHSVLFWNSTGNFLMFWCLTSCLRESRKWNWCVWATILECFWNEQLMRLVWILWLAYQQWLLLYLCCASDVNPALGKGDGGDMIWLSSQFQCLIRCLSLFV